MRKYTQLEKDLMYILQEASEYIDSSTTDLASDIMSSYMANGIFTNNILQAKKSVLEYDSCYTVVTDFIEYQSQLCPNISLILNFFKEPGVFQVRLLKEILSNLILSNPLYQQISDNNNYTVQNLVNVCDQILIDVENNHINFNKIF